MPCAHAWNSGSAVSRTSPSPYPIMCFDDFGVFRYQPWGSMQPFGMPVVPDVYMIAIKLAWVISGCGTGALDERMRVYGIASPSPSSRTTMRFSSGTSSRTAFTACNPAASATSVDACESCSWYRRKSPFKKTLSGTWIAPSFASAKNSSSISGRFDEITATRSPAATPVSASPAATASVRRSVSAYVQRSASHHRKSRSG